MADMIAKSGFYDGKFRKAGQRHNGPASDDVTTTDDDRVKDLNAMTKDELIAEAEKRGVDVKSSDTKADIIAALKA